MISNLDPANPALPVRKGSCVWRPDVGSRLYARSSWQAAGGVGGLAWMQTGIAQTAAMDMFQSITGNAKVHVPMIDHMRNVRHHFQIKATGSGASASDVTGQIAANLDFDPFGREVRATGPKTPASGQPPGLTAGDPWVDVLPFHFSTKFTDRESGRNYYGYRFYDPVDGRWLSRDPMGESGGITIYGASQHSFVLIVDHLGLYNVEIKFTESLDNENNKLVELNFMNVKVEPCEIVMVDSHGVALPAIQEHEWEFDQEECKTSFGGFVGCDQRSNKESIPEDRRIVPTNRPDDGSVFRDSGAHHMQQQCMLMSAFGAAVLACECPQVKIIKLDICVNLKIDGTLEFTYDCSRGRAVKTRREGSGKKDGLKNYKLSSEGSPTGSESNGSAGYRVR